MRIIIDIDDGIAQGIIEGINDEPRNIVRSFQATIADAIINGTPLPENHGDLKDLQYMYVNMIGKEGIARQKAIDTSAISHCLKRYNTQLNERIAFKEMLNDSPMILKANEEEVGI